MRFEQRYEGKEVSHADLLKKKVIGRGNIKCQGLEAGIFLEC